MTQGYTPLILVLEALGGLGIFILGMRTMSDGLQRLAGDRLRRLLERLAGNRLTAALMGSCLAYLLQSSGAASVLVIGFVNAGLISLYQALAVLLGTGIGTSIALQLVAFRVSFLALPAVFVGVSLKFFGRRRKTVYLGEILLGVGLLFFGLQTMEAYFAPLRGNAIFGALSSSRVYALFSGVLLTFLVQSGRTAVAIAIALAGSGLLTIETGAAMIFGEAIGTSCITAIGAIGGTLAAKRTVLSFFIINILAVAGALLLIPPLVKFVLLFSPDISRALANAHTIFSAASALLFLPLIGFFARFAPLLLPDSEQGMDMEPHARFLDMRVINTPPIAFSQAKNEVKRMAEVARSMYGEVTEQFQGFDARKSLRIKQKEQVLDFLQRDIANFLVALARQPLPPDISLEIPSLLHKVNDLEEIGDRSEAILDYLRRKKEDKVLFSQNAMDELKGIALLVGHMLALAVRSLDDRSAAVTDEAGNLRERLRLMEGTLKSNHMKRLNSGKCTVLAGLVYIDIVSAFARIGECASSIIEEEGGLTP